MAVDDEFLREHMNDLAIIGKRDRFRGIDGTKDIFPRDLSILVRYSNHGSAVEAFDVTAREADMRALDLDTGHELGLVHHPLDGIHCLLEVYDHPFAQSFGSGGADTDDVEAPLFCNFGDDSRDLRRADVEAYDVFVSFAQNDAPPGTNVAAV